MQVETTFQQIQKIVDDAYSKTHEKSNYDSGAPTLVIAYALFAVAEAIRYHADVTAQLPPDLKDKYG